jgi:hypothetical protein
VCDTTAEVPIQNASIFAGTLKEENFKKFPHFKIILFLCPPATDPDFKEKYDQN